MAAAKAAVLAQLEPVGGVLFVLERVVVPALALGACHRYHHAVLFFCHRSIRKCLAPDIKKTGPGPFQAFMIAYRQAPPQGRSCGPARRLR